MTIHEFDPEIYPRKLWVVVGNYKIDGFSIKTEFGKDSVPLLDDSNDAATIHVHDDIRDLGGIMIRFMNKKSMSVQNIAHESYHAACEIYKYIGADIGNDDQEPLGYLIGWVAKCCNEVKNK